MGTNRLGVPLEVINPAPFVIDFASIARKEGVSGLTSNTSLSGSQNSFEAHGNAERRAERIRIAQELHDTLLQGFVAVSMQLHLAVDQLSADCPAQPQLRDVVQLLDRVLEQSRYTVQGLRTPVVSSLVEGLAAVPRELGLTSAIAFRVTLHGRERELRDGLCDEVNRIGREAIINAYRHSRATDIEVQLEYGPAELCLTVRDNGCGIDMQNSENQRMHWGLQGMRERAKRIGARLRLCSGTARGTEVELRLPAEVAFEPVRGSGSRANHTALLFAAAEYQSGGVA